MVERKEIEEIISGHLEESDLFLVDIVISNNNDIEVTIDSLNGVNIDNCTNISRLIEGALDREKEDFSLTITSAGLEQPFKVAKQYEKFIGREVEVLLKSGVKLVAVLSSFNEEALQLIF